MWLDLARYADSKGYEKDKFRNIWRYRDYLIQSFNKDKPYDVFVQEQLAGDLLPNASDEQILATKFHRNTVNNDEGGTDNEEFRTAEVIDRVSTTFDVLQGVTIGCVQCHTHPYDPIRHKEYYKVMAFLNNTADEDTPDDYPLHVVQEDFNLDKGLQVIKEINLLQGIKAEERERELKALRAKYLRPWLDVRDADVRNTMYSDVYTVKVNEGDYVLFKNVDLTGVREYGCTYIADKGCTVEFRLDRLHGPLLAKLNVETTFGEWYGKNVKKEKASQGKHDVYGQFKPYKGSCDGFFHAFSFMRTEKLDYTNEVPAVKKQPKI